LKYSIHFSKHAEGYGYSVKRHSRIVQLYHGGQHAHCLFLYLAFESLDLERI